MKRAVLAAVLMLGASAACAQQTFSEVQRAIAQQSEQVRVNVVMNMFVPAPAGMGDQALASHERARRQMYDLAKRECVVLQEVIAKDCRIEAINVNVNRHQGQQQVEGFTIGANMNFRVTLK